MLHACWEKHSGHFMPLFTKPCTLALMGTTQPGAQRLRWLLSQSFRNKAALFNFAFLAVYRKSLVDPANKRSLNVSLKN